jgi:hypothetical protein
VERRSCEGVEISVKDLEQLFEEPCMRAYFELCPWLAYIDGLVFRGFDEVCASTREWSDAFCSVRGFFKVLWLRMHRICLVSLLAENVEDVHISFRTLQ